jgi:hypothetical protein
LIADAGRGVLGVLYEAGRGVASGETGLSIPGTGCVEDDVACETTWSDGWDGFWEWKGWDKVIGRKGLNAKLRRSVLSRCDATSLCGAGGGPVRRCRRSPPPDLCGTYLLSLS